MMQQQRLMNLWPSGKNNKTFREWENSPTPYQRKEVNKFVSGAKF